MPKWHKFGTLIGQLFKIFRNLRQNGANFSEKFWFLVHGWVTFPSKWVHGWVAFQKSQRHTPTQTKVEYPPGTPPDLDLVIMQVPVSHSVQRGLKPTLFFCSSLYIKPHFLQKQTYPPFCRSCFSKINMMQIYTTPLNATIFLTIVWLPSARE